ncbi:Agamous-like MADS-box protein AGL80 [Forsythia ovata]|uniref:Agamous-like MADS-box protein AGL80 n=1 Tax=Forsythia ovata TaxID=205694 RepID=A0ABD1U5Z9_9LAMI
MVRSKIKYELIADERARKETFRKRKLSLFKKLNEFKTLCNVEACAVISNENGAQPEFWPSPPEAFNVIQTFKNLPSSSQTSNMVNGEGFLKQNLSRLAKNLDKEKWKVQSLEQELLLDKCLSEESVLEETNSGDLQKLLCLLEKKMRMVDDNIVTLEHSDSTVISSVKEIGSGSTLGKGKQPL